MVKKPLRPRGGRWTSHDKSLSSPSWCKKLPTHTPQLHRNDPPQSRWLRQAIPDQQSQNRFSPRRIFQPTTNPPSNLKDWFARIPLPTSTTNQLPISSSTNYQLPSICYFALRVFLRGEMYTTTDRSIAVGSSSSSGSSFQGAENQRFAPSIDEKVKILC